ncbi:hypothetical protein BaRGS_00001810 [Batillaria attramentaria]|uniref:Altered inheritance of mitochondria protein 24, mitochondrial n=1 Tax=Batillaria attramentaria TaxID=370345 RepID=A0ABD0M4W9_9CAEN
MRPGENTLLVGQLCGRGSLFGNLLGSCFMGECLLGVRTRDRTQKLEITDDGKVFLPCKGASILIGRVRGGRSLFGGYVSEQEATGV